MPDPIPSHTPGVTLVAVAVVEHAGRYLVGRRPEGQALAGYAEFPGGKRRRDESMAETAARECLEETGLAVQVHGLRSVVRHAYEHGELELHFFDCRAVSQNAGALQPRHPFRWVAPQELAELLFPPANESVIREILRERTP